MLRKIPNFIRFLLPVLILGSVFCCDHIKDKANLSDQKNNRTMDGKVTKEIEVPCVPPPDEGPGQCFLDLAEFGLQLNYPSDWVYLRNDSGKSTKSDVFIGLKPDGQLVAHQFAIMVFKGKTMKEVEEKLNLRDGKTRKLEGKTVSTWNYYLVNPANPFEYYSKASGGFIHVLEFHVGAHYLNVARDVILKSLGSYSVNAEK